DPKDILIAIQPIVEDLHGFARHDKGMKTPWEWAWYLIFNYPE
ncbi:hypothetical protein WJX84_006941, partial [Apatococcus fuscideae]